MYTFETGENISQAIIQQQLERILAWPPFKNSRRYPRFLKYVVEKTLSGSADELKERVIGMEVFDRSADYEPASDPVVRLVAGEIRKRLAQYYIQEEHIQELRIEILPGSYVPAFRWPQHGPVTTEAAPAASDEPLPAPVAFPPAPPQASTTSRGWPARWIALAAGLLIVAVSAGQWWVASASRRALNDFWRPLYANAGPILICIGEWQNDKAAASDSFNRISPGESYVGPYDLDASSKLQNALNIRGQQYSILMSNATTFAELRSQPAIFIGAYNNRWTPMILAPARFQFRSDMATDQNYLVDTRSPDGRKWTVDVRARQLQPMSMTQEVGLITRVTSPATGQTELVIAGVSRSGTVAASEFVSRPDYFRQFLDQAPKGWDSRNIQIVVTADVINAVSGPPHMVAFDVW